ncbi:MAG: signal peptidase I [Oscillospiraceae bacterium]|nr:signal peptidase I [Oscillospiraceae bacterium]
MTQSTFMKPINNKKFNPVADFYDWIETFLYALALVVLMFTFLFRFVTVDGESMTHTLKDKDYLIISDLDYKPKTGDIIVFDAMKYNGGVKPLIKRVIATEGQTVDIDFDTWQVYVDGVLLDEPYVRRETTGRMEDGDRADMYPITVDKNCVFVMGDNRNGSRDSRMSNVDQIDTRYILGRVLVRFFPFEAAGKVN